MKRALTLALAAFLVVSSTGLVLAKKPVLTGDGSEPGEMAAAAAMADPCFVDVLGINCTLDADLDNIVAFDTSNGAYPWQNNNHCELIKDLQASGYNVRRFDLTPYPATPELPYIGTCIDTVVITSLANNFCLLSKYTPEQASYIWDWVDQGHGLLLLNEWGIPSHPPGYPNLTCGSGTAPVADKVLDVTWDVTWNANGAEAPGGGQVGTPTTFTANTNFNQDNPASLFWNVPSWEAYSISDYTNTTGVGNVVTRVTGEPVMIDKTYGAGCAVIVGDTNWAVDDWIGNSNNRALANNVFGYLEACGQLWANPGRWIRGRGNIDSPAAAVPEDEASFAFVAKYKKVLTDLQGNVSLVDDAAGAVFESSSFARLATGSNQAKVTGTGTGTFRDFPSPPPDDGVYKFVLWAGDDVSDTFRIKIYYEVGRIVTVVYDNGCDDCPVPPITKGGIALHGKE